MMMFVITNLTFDNADVHVDHFSSIRRHKYPITANKNNICGIHSQKISKRRLKYLNEDNEKRKY